MTRITQQVMFGEILSVSRATIKLILGVPKTVYVVLPLTRTGLATPNKKFLAETAS